MSRKQIGLLLTFLMITTLACATSKTTPQSGATDAPSPTATQAGEVVAATPGGEGTTPETASPDAPASAPTGTPTPGCTFAAAYVADVTVPDDAVFLPNTPFVKTWRIRNSGTCDWESGYLFVYISDDPLGGPTSVALPAAVVGANVDVTVNFVSPDAPGTYRSNWQAQTSSGERFGGQFYVQIIVPEPTLAPTIEPTAAPTAAPVVSDWPAYHNGDKGPNVYALQYLLKAEGASITADGIFGMATQEAVKTFQTARGLTANGVVDEQTWRALIHNHVLKQGNASDAVYAAQHLLVNVYGYSSIAVDGIFGPATRNAVKTFQTAHNLTADGIVGENTWKALIVGP